MLQDLEGGDQLRAAELGAAAALVGERRQRTDGAFDDVGIVEDRAIGRLHSPDRYHDVTVDAVTGFDLAEEGGVLIEERLAGGDALLGNGAVKVEPDLLVELGLAARLLENFRVGGEIAERRVVGRPRDPGGLGGRPERPDPLRRGRGLYRAREEAKSDKQDRKAQGTRRAAHRMHGIHPSRPRHLPPDAVYHNMGREGHRKPRRQPRFWRCEG